MHLCTHPDNKMARNSSRRRLRWFCFFIGLVLGACVDTGQEAPGRRSSGGSGRRRKGGARKEGEGELAAAARTADPAAAAAVGAAGAEAGRDLCSSGIHGVELALSGCWLLWEDDGGGSACQGEAKGRLGKGKGIAGEVKLGVFSVGRK